MELVIVTGLSGAGKSLAMNALEDIGYFCIDKSQHRKAHGALAIA